MVVRWREPVGAQILAGSETSSLRKVLGSVSYGKEYNMAECNNCLVYPGIGLRCVPFLAEKLSNEMIVAAAHAVAELAPCRRE